MIGDHIPVRDTGEGVSDVGGIWHFLTRTWARKIIGEIRGRGNRN